MTKLIVVDDNKRILAGIRKMLDWESMGVEIIGTYSNSAAALASFDNDIPDIVLTDIIIPKINGIELAEKIKQRNPQVKIIFMSCSDDFDYVKSAVFLDIEAYILKPIVEDELEMAILKAVDKKEKDVASEEEKNKIIAEKNMILDEINRFLPLYREQFIRELLLGAIPNDEEITKRSRFLEMNFENSSYCVFSFTLGSGSLGKYINVDDIYFTSYAITKIITEYKNDSVKVFPFKPYESEIDVLVVFDDAEFNKKNLILDTAVELNELISSKYDLPIVIGVSSISSEFANAKRYYLQAKEATGYNQYNSRIPVIFYEDIKSVFDNDFKEKIDMQVIYNEVEDIIMNPSQGRVNEFICKYFRESRGNLYLGSLLTTILNDVQIIMIRLGKPLSSLPEEKLQEFNLNFTDISIANAELWVKHTFKTVKEILEGSNKYLNEQIVENIKNIIKVRYKENINIEVMLDALPISSGYANVIFKQLEGKTIFNYLTDYRIQVAKKLLLSPQSKVYYVANEVGYLNKSHFCLLFKKSTGLTPSEFKDKFAKFPSSR